MLVKGYRAVIFCDRFDCSHVYKTLRKAKETILFPKKGSLERKYGIIEATVYEEYFDIDLNNSKYKDQLNNECKGDVFKLINLHLYDYTFSPVQSIQVMKVYFGG